jgi:type VI secretion system protein ImpM
MSGGGDGSPVGVYGKVPGQADFLRGNAGDFSQAGLDRWFEGAMETMRTDGGRLPDAPTAFLLAPAESRRAFVGVFAPSTDAVGRTFPLIVFTDVATESAAQRLAAVPFAYRPFLEDAALLVMLPPASGAEVVDRVQALGGGRPELEPNRSFMPPLGAETAQALVTALGGSPRALGYALRTFVAACDQALKTGPGATTGVITVDAPIPTPGCRQMWLELASRRLHWRDAIPSLLWTEGVGGRLLLTLGAPSAVALSYLCNPRHRAHRFWPLRTEVGAAIDQAMNALTPEQRRRVEDPHTSLGDLLAAFV